ncbi:hypothetical protein TRICI_002881 [Trichomonascus ciferrii]|uniref:Xylanolytic transcriptional activator regulatory domain-containing protein n=1 Tax=Trichomonascus ciferrii TaxID=44093 RepID=A0A642V585_9ASCO|nr:hypothetical protein TRICI_002881 [Trichomonascus ciferrii]
MSENSQQQNKLLATKPSWSNFPDGLLRTLVNAYFDYMNPIVPIMDRELTLKYLESEPSEDIYTLVVTLAAVPLKRVRSLTEEYQEPDFRRCLLAEAMRVKGMSPAFITNPNINCVKTSFFLYLNFCATEEYDVAWYYLQEAITLGRILKIDNEAAYHNLTPIEDTDRRLLFWGLFVSERGFSIHERKPIVLGRSINLPEPEKLSIVHREFVPLIQLMSSVDDDFYPLWLNPIAPLDPCAQMIARMQNKLQSAFPADFYFQSSIQRSNVLITQPWLLLLLWRLNHQWTTVQTSPMDSHFPLYAATTAHRVVSSVTVQDLLAHGPGMRKKLFDITHTLAESIILQPQLTTGPDALEKRNILLSLSETVRSISQDTLNEFRLLETKVKEALQSHIFTYEQKSNIPNQAPPGNGPPTPLSDLFSELYPLANEQ